MTPFANLLDRLVYTPGRNAKLKLLVDDKQQMKEKCNESKKKDEKQLPSGK